MKLTTLFTTSVFAVVATAHSTVWNIYVNDVNQGIGNTAGGYIRFPPSNSPIKDITSTDLTCNVANTAATKTVSAAAGDKITVEWHHNDNTASDDIIDGSHKGPVMVYIAPTSSNGAGDVWVKLAEAGFSSGTWAVDTLKTNGGKHSFTLPSALVDGEYLIRPEIIALHEAEVAFTTNPARGAQFYMECIQLNVAGGGGSTTLPAGVAIPGAYKYTDPGVVFNMYGTVTSYTIPGPAVWDLASGGSASPAPVSSAVASSVESSTPTSAPAAPAGGATTTIYACSTMSTVIVPAASSAAVGGSVSAAVAKYAQCGGKEFSASTSCVAGTTCQVINDYYSQCL